MKNNKISIKENVKEVKVKLNQAAKEFVTEMGKNIKWLQFAKKTENGYRFLNNKEKQLETLETITSKFIKNNSSYNMRDISFLLSEMVNNPQQ